jgi:uncharacterized protein YfiM (DUF2279 family)
MEHTRSRRFYNLRTWAGRNRIKTTSLGPCRRIASVFPLLAWLSCAGCASFRACDQGDDWWGSDKKKHFAAAALIGAGVTFAASTQADPGESAALGVTVAMVVGLGKEGYDLEVKKTCWSWKDLVWDFIGASAGASAAVAMTR